MRPLIALTLDHVKNGSLCVSPPAYKDAVAAAGGVPVLLPYTEQLDEIPRLVSLFDGLLATGGEDPDPARWGEPRHPQTNPVDPVKEAFDLAVIEAFEQAGKPILGICLGMQLMNISRGGTLIQFLPHYDRPDHLEAIEHRKLDKDAEAPRHQVHVNFGGRLHQLVKGDCIWVNSLHKQAVGRLGQGLHLAAVAVDGVIEAIDDPKRPFHLGVQWHPEKLTAEPEHAALFEALVNAARRG
ncbi:MAG: gamma-glutamyl-gamma-aminobutyrate hydrolase family protein [Phycisphaerae bacterium]